MKNGLFLLLILLMLAESGCVAKKRAIRQDAQNDYPYQNAVEYRKANQKPVETEKGGHPLPPRPEKEQDASQIFPGRYVPDTGKGFAVLQKLAQGDYYFQTSISYGKNASTFEGKCYQVENRVICPIDYDIDENFNPVEAYIELEQVNPARIRLLAHYTLPGLFGQGLPEFFSRKANVAGRPGVFVKPRF